MQLGIFAKTFPRDTLEENLDAITSHGYECVQYNMVCAGLTPMPDAIDAALCDRIRSAMAQRHIHMAAISGTFNIIDPDLDERENGFRRLRILAESCERLGTQVITFCTGTRDPTNMWKRHPDNDTAEAWSDMVLAMRRAVDIAEECGVLIGFEPEVNNVVDSAIKGRRLMDEIGSSHLKVVIDGANMFHTGQLPRMREVLDEAFSLLGKDIALAHAKDLSHDGDAGHEAAGTGLLDYDYYLSLLRDSGFDGALITHGLEESQSADVAAFLRGKLASL
jgi:sugar phosphate isomerase/epimerase